jgi:hypothetical protein
LATKAGESKTTDEIMSESTEGAASKSTAEPTTTDDATLIVFTPTAESPTTEEIISKKTMESKTTDEIVLVSSKSTADLTATEENTAGTTMTDEIVLVSSTKTVELKTTEGSISRTTANFRTTGSVITSTTDSRATEDAVSANTEEWSKKDEPMLPMRTTNVEDEAESTEETVGKSISTTEEMITDEMITAEELTPQSNIVSTTEEMAIQKATLQYNVPGITLESLSGFKVDIPEGCFDRIDELCQSNAVKVTFCSNSVVSDLLVKQAWTHATNSLGIPLLSKNANFSTSVTHNSTCEGNQEIGWIEIYEIISTDSKEPNTTYEAAVILVTPLFSSVSLLQFHAAKDEN